MYNSAIYCLFDRKAIGVNCPDLPNVNSDKPLRDKKAILVLQLFK